MTCPLSNGPFLGDHWKLIVTEWELTENSTSTVEVVPPSRKMDQHLGAFQNWWYTPQMDPFE